MTFGELHTVDTGKTHRGLPVVRLTRPFTYSYGTDGFCASFVPAGFETNYASVPRPFWFIFPPTGEPRRPSVAHDYHYATESVPRVLADVMFGIGCTQEGMTTRRAAIGVLALMLFGWWNYGKPKTKAKTRRRAIRLIATVGTAAIVFAIALAVLLILAAAPAEAKPLYKRVWDERYGAVQPQTLEQQTLKARVEVAKCNVCHLAGNDAKTGKPYAKTYRNAYGTVLAREIRKPITAKRIEAEPETVQRELLEAFMRAESARGSHGYTYGDVIRAGYLPTGE